MAVPEAFSDRDDAQDAPLVLRSPTFELVPGGAISVHALGGTPGESAAFPTNYSEISGPSINTDGMAPEGDTSFLGVALRRDSDGAYLLTRHRITNSVSYSSWQNLLFTEAELAPIISNNPGQLFTLDVIDTAHGAFGTLAIDAVSIPASAPTNIFQGDGVWHIQERLSNGVVNGLADAEALLALPSDDPNVQLDVITEATTIDYNDFTASSGRFEADDYFPAGVTNFATRITGNIHITQGGPVTFGFHANDGALLRINGNLVAVDNARDIATDTLGSIVLTPGVHEVEFIFFQAGFGASVELFAATTIGEFDSLADGVWDLLVATDLLPPEGIPGDYNNDRVVDAADYVVWRNALNTDAELPNDDTPGVTIEDYDVWKQHYGMSSQAAAGLAAAAQVPEPSCLWMVVCGAIAWGACRCCRNRCSS